MSVSLQRRRSFQTLDAGFPTLSRQSSVSQKVPVQLPTALYPGADRSRFGGINKKVPRSLCIGSNLATLVYLLLLGGLGLGWRRFANRKRGPTTIAPCYAPARPGRLLVNLTSPLHTHWRPLDEDACPALPLYLPALWHLSKGPDEPPPHYPLADYSDDYRLRQAETMPRRYLKGAGSDADDAVAFLRKKRAGVPPTVLILGDSVDRNALVHFCQLMQQQITISMYDDIKSQPEKSKGDLTMGHGPKFHGWDQRGLPHLCEVPFYSPPGKEGKGNPKGKDGLTAKPDIAMRVVNGFHYGMDALDEFDTPDHLDWHKPGKIDTRIDELVVPMLEQMGGTDKVDLVILHSGMWDLALFGLQDDKTKWSLTVPLSPEQLAWWQERMRKTIFHVRHVFPDARIVLRNLHRTDDVVAGTQYITNLSVLRVHQLRHLTREVARVEKVPTFDFGRLIEGYQLFQEKVHPLLLPGGVVYAQNLMHQLRLALEGHRM